MRNLATKSVLLIFTLLLAACGAQSQKSNSEETVITVKPKANINTLYYNGILEPLSLVNVPSPADAQIQSISFHYGEQVKQGQLLLTISSKKLGDDYTQTLSEFLKVKEEYIASEGKWRGTAELNALGLMSANDFSTAVKQREQQRLSYLQQRQKLEEILQRTREEPEELMREISRLTLDDVEQVNAALSNNEKELRVTSPRDGVVLYSASKSSSGSGGGAPDRLVPGMAVKEGDSLLAIGDLSGFRMDVDVNEVDILQLRAEMPVTVTGVAFPGITLAGHVSSIGTQAIQGNGGVPVFQVGITVPKVTPEELKKVHVGMSSRIQVEIKSPPEITVPIQSVWMKDGQEMVYLIKEGKKTAVAVTTGKTSIDEVTITKGLKAGDQIVVPR